MGLRTSGARRRSSIRPRMAGASAPLAASRRAPTCPTTASWSTDARDLRHLLAADRLRHRAVRRTRGGAPMKRLLRENSLTLVFLGLCLAALVFQAFAGHAAFNAEQDQLQAPHVSFWRYVFSSAFGVAVMENWQSEYLQFTLFIVLTVWLVQRGSPESKEPGKAGTESDADQRVGEHARSDSPAPARWRGIGRRLYENSLLIVMGSIWLGTWV